MKTKFFMFAITQTYVRTGEKIGKTVGVVKASSKTEAEDKVWKEYGGNNACCLTVWEVENEIEAYTVYKSVL